MLRLHLLEKRNLVKAFFGTVNAMLKARGRMLNSGTVIDATIIAAPTTVIFLLAISSPLG